MKYLILILTSLFLISCASSETTESTGQFIDSATITAKVKTALAKHDGFRSLNIKVTTYKNKVQLSGFVNNDDEKAMAEKIALQIPGVKSVRNSLVIK